MLRGKERRIDVRQVEALHLRQKIDKEKMVKKVDGKTVKDSEIKILQK